MNTAKITLDWEGSYCGITQISNRLREGERAIELLKQQYSADKALYDLPDHCTKEEHEKALEEHDAIHQLIAEFLYN